MLLTSCFWWLSVCNRGEIAKAGGVGTVGGEGVGEAEGMFCHEVREIDTKGTKTTRTKGRWRMCK